jgi:pimeloyl-ACP methyl ester carboxylesterase
LAPRTSFVNEVRARSSSSARASARWPHSTPWFTGSVDAAAFVEIAGVNDRSGYAFSREQLEALEGAKLFVSSADDPYSAADAARAWHRWAKQPKQLEILPGSAHGTDMLIEGQPTARPLMELITAFLTRAVPPG